MATEASGDSTTAKTTSSTTTTFFFRPSALSDVADKMWKKSSGDSSGPGANENHGAQGLFNLPPLSTFSSSGNTTNIFLNCSSATPSSPFIFGKNISRRVANASDGAGNAAPSGAGKEQKDEKAETGLAKDKDQPEAGDAKGTRTEVSFDVLAATSTTTDALADSNGATSTTATSEEAAAVLEDAAARLEASAAAYEAAKHQTHKQPQLLAPEEVKTGEEDEMNVVQASVKLYVFDTAKQSWTDRGQAIIRVNDRRVADGSGDNEETRIVVRLQGSLRVIVNTKLWPDMLLERVSAKRLRLSGTVEDSLLPSADSEKAPGISIYLISASQAADVDRIEKALRDRIARLKPVEQCAVSKKRPMEHSDESESFSDEQGESPAKKRELDEQGDK